MSSVFDFKPGDLVSLSGHGWDKFGLRNEEAEIVGRDEVGPKVALQHDDGQNYRVVCNEQFGDYSAELVEAAPLAHGFATGGYTGTVPGRLVGADHKPKILFAEATGEVLKFTQVAGDVNPSHYDFPGGVQVIDITKHLDFLTGNVVKYVSRAGRKGDRMTDLLKAKKYLEWAIEQEEGK